MTKKQKRIVMYLAAFLVALALVSICLVGNTFARFVTTSSSVAETDVAYYKVGKTDGTLNTSQNIDLGDLSPAVNAAGATSGVYNETDPALVSTIDVTSDVDVNVTINVGYVTYTANSGCTIETTGTFDGSGNASVGDLDNVFTLNVYYKKGDAGAVAPVLAGTDASSLSGWTQIEAGNTSSAISVSASTSTTYISIYAFVTWTTDYTNYSTLQGTLLNGTSYYLADLLDAWIGENVATVGTTLTINAVQNTQIPSA